MKVKFNKPNPKEWAEKQLKYLIAKHIIKYMDEWLAADDVRKAVEDAREELVSIAYGENGDNLIEDANTN